jgi:uncharacterized protein (TIGR00375 family)
MDAHLHSRFSRATSQNMNIDGLFKWAKYKGVDLIGTGDFTHPFWLAELKEKLKEEDSGLLKFKNVQNNKDPLFILTSEISAIYTQGNKVRKIHLVIFSPSFEVVDKINQKLEKIGNLYADGRPIFGASAKDLAKIIFDVCPDCLIVPAHAWTPWFSIFGSNSGFDSVEECFGELTSRIYALETGLSSDPAMNWRLSKLDRYTLVSFSDAHSPGNLGREATVFDLEGSSYQEIYEAIKNKDSKKILYTIEFFPEEGKYHYDGHRMCGISLSPEESKKFNNKCPKCGRPLTIGVMHRVIDLADREENFVPENAIPYKSLVPLDEIIAESLGQQPTSKAVLKEYLNLVQQVAPELPLLLDAPLEELKGRTLPQIIEGIKKVREGQVEKIPGYDGVYGIIKLKEGKSGTEKPRQQKLF